MVRNLWKYRGLIVRHAADDLRNRYRGSLAGYFWNVITPLAQIIIFSTIFGVLLQQKLGGVEGMEDHWVFVVFLCSGLLPWNAFADTLMRGVSSLVGNAGYLKKLPLPEQVFVAQDACSGFFTALLTLGVFFVFCILIVGYGPYWAWLQAIPGLILMMGLAFGLGLTMSCINVFFRDVQPAMNVIVLLWFWLTPIVYPEHMFENTSHAWLLRLLPLNPAYHFVEVFHASIFQHRLVGASTWVICIASTAVVNVVAYAVLRVTRSDIRDVL